jgi:hypothetical protein
MPPEIFHHFHFSSGHQFSNPEMGTCVRLEASGVMAKKSEVNCALRSAGVCKGGFKAMNKQWVEPLHFFHHAICRTFFVFPPDNDTEVWPD